MSVKRFIYPGTEDRNPSFDGEAFRREWHRYVGSTHRASHDSEKGWHKGDLILCYSEEGRYVDERNRLKAELEADPRNVGNVLVACAAAARWADRKLFLDENGEPSDLSGPDLRNAPPIEEVIKGLRGLRTGPSGLFSMAFCRACTASGIWLSVNRTEEGEDRLMMGEPMDAQSDLRRDRVQALRKHLLARPQRRDAVIYLLNLLGRFADNQPFASAEEAVEAYVAAGGQIRLATDGSWDAKLFLSKQQEMEEGWHGYPIQRVVQRFGAMRRQPGMKEAIAGIVRAQGMPCGDGDIGLRAMVEMAA